MTTVVQLRRFGVVYRSNSGNDLTALDAVDLDIFAGEKIAIVGESGSGKSSLALALAGLLPPDASRGTMNWIGREPKAGRDIGFVFQDPGSTLNPVKTVGHTIAEVVRAHSQEDRGSACQTTQALLRDVRLPDPERLSRAYPYQLSGGQKQRVALAAALAGRPSILIADEPTSALDTVVQAEIVDLINTLSSQRQMTLIFVSHDIALVSRFADRIAVFRAGKLVEAGSSATVISTPQDPYTRHLIDAHRAVGF